MNTLHEQLNQYLPRMISHCTESTDPQYFANEIIIRIGNFSLGKKFGSELAYCLHN